jgi:hypothetical protein
MCERLYRRPLRTGGDRRQAMTPIGAESHRCDEFKLRQPFGIVHDQRRNASRDQSFE